ncbi:DNA primase [Paraburkholderia sp. Ac-20342]|uniref:LPD7 domain-containing protein n=1 Tax=Paraburkholderia sp. Ac-20342 TaxID=2703889 RepID=UPI00197D7248|nr:LPD7 domain-containing protein [Paraburkholderia sp. Ac-20342]MBN3846099.1 DNA primase [Paraburkholderia sp. Ac-20342]
MAETTSAQAADPVINVIEQDVPGSDGDPVPTDTHWDTLDSAARDAVSARRRREFDAARARLRDQAIRDDPGAEVQADQQAGPPAPAEAAAGGDRNYVPLERPPERVTKRYMRSGNQYFLKDAPFQLAFEDLGPYLVTEHNRPDVVESMLDMVHAKSWQRVRVSGHEAFRREVWLQATLNGIEVTGYEPKAADLARLADARQARLDNRIEVAPLTTAPMAATGPQSRADTRSPASEATPSAPASAANGASSPAPVHDAEREPHTPRADRSAAGDEPDAPRRYVGELREHGGAPYLHNPARSDSYYVVFRDPAGVDQAVWGVDLERAVRESGAGIGQPVVLENLGKRLVTVRVPVFDGEGNVVREEDKDVYRNTWQVDVAQRDRDASVPPGSYNRTVGDSRAAASQTEPVMDEVPHRHGAARRPEIDQTVHLAVLVTAMRNQGFSERSIARVQQQAERLLVAFAKDGARIPAPKVFDPKAPSGRDQRRRPAPERTPALEIDREPASPAPMSPSR